MARAVYSASTGTAVAAPSAAAKTVLGVVAPAQFGVDLFAFAIGFDGVDATKTPILVELCYATFATNAPGTNSTSVTPQQIAGRAITAGFTAARNWTAEPTVLTPIWNAFLTPNAGLVGKEWSVEKTPDSAVSNGFAIRVTTVAGSATPNLHATLEFGRA